MNSKLEIRFQELSKILVEEINDDGFWTGRLSSSALGVSVAIAALHFHNRKANKKEIQKGISWLKSNINSDGSYGDTPESKGNTSTSLLVYAALNLYSEKDNSLHKLQNKIAVYLQQNKIDIYSEQVAETILAHYKNDYTFSVPILTMCALCGIPKNDGFKRIPNLPFELALLPKKFYRFLNLSVVSYAIPALIAVGIVIFKKKKAGRLARNIRKRAEKKALKILQKSMPKSGGFLEAIPLTAFVSLSLINAGHRQMNTVKRGIQFLKQTQREDGGWPIDVDLSTWVTCLSIKSVAARKDDILTQEQQTKLITHLKSLQNKTKQPFSGTTLGGWGWTNYSGSVPDGDDTPGAILALLQLAPHHTITREIIQGGKWLLKLQNNDGGFPTFSRGWGKLPFDQSCADLTGHCFLALATLRTTYINEISRDTQKKIKLALNKSLNYLLNHQQGNGSWVPLWFGNQFTTDHKNPVYGTARVLTYLNDALTFLTEDLFTKTEQLINRGEKFLLEVQNDDGSWGGDKDIPGTMEETALAVSALSKTNHSDACNQGLFWLNTSFKTNGLKAAPIGLYFASLWYHEKMYPLTAYLEALTRMR